MFRSLPNSALEKYVCHTVTEVLIKLFEKPSADQPIMDVTVSLLFSLFCLFLSISIHSVWFN